jgi:hypothetical protein
LDATRKIVKIFRQSLFLTCPSSKNQKSSIVNIPQKAATAPQKSLASPQEAAAFPQKSADNS